MSTKQQALAFLLIATSSLAACADLPFRLPGERAAELPPEKGLVVFKADTVGDRPAKRIQYSDNEQRVDYTLYRGGGAQAEFIYMERPYQLNVAFNFGFTIADKVGAWNFSKGQAVDFGKAMQVRTRVGYVFYRPYKLPAANQQCFGVSGEWDRAQDDPKLRHTRILFGYYCAPQGQALSEEQALKLVDNIGLRGVTDRAQDADSIYNFHTDVAANFSGPQGTEKAMNVARNGDGKAGITEFPFRYAEYYNRGDSHDRNN
jgi:hypothetical protein